MKNERINPLLLLIEGFEEHPIYTERDEINLREFLGEKQDPKRPKTALDLLKAGYDEI